MHPILRHVPPRTEAPSTHAVLSPSCPARIAALYPPTPLPITTTSYRLSVGLLMERRRRHHLRRGRHWLTMQRTSGGARNVVCPGKDLSGWVAPTMLH